ncbi:uncharacterized protein LOC117171216 [Belonocnema kinseyi]|uniref:uncharacterized protein LOC117171216 n=1 Tax=Belonocnema kinseyi TaxID=2817044 RepID=UPI00143D3B6E|nr:uncharacterized protein LOC117171216 [Belonocnema kinseyi]XP_033214202.1 uncharacterized protein LOC117171216 [Belonocnema kinseyi]XP_033214203.1 uncharacterized protein LOC117171216 [Belonocnema kinseyi]XP_033214205.1 uncharacterized protein LOC117171216 [Belonocnema kinseyi]
MSNLSETPPIQNLECVLREFLGSQLKIESMQWKHLVDPGENFGSLILALNLNVKENGKSENLNLIAKLPPKSEYLVDLFNSPMSFYKEIYFYKIIAPELIKFQIENGMKKSELIKLVPQFFGGRLGVKDGEKFDDQATIVLENLKVQGYDTEDRITGMDKEHMIFAIKQLARLHAIPICYKIKKPKAFKELIMPGLASIFNEATIRCVEDMINKAVNTLETMKEAQPYMEKVTKTIEYGASKIEEEPEEPWATLVHSDFWVNNMLFRHDKSGKIIDMKMVDLQLTQYENGCRDLIFLIMSSAKLKVIDESLDEMIDSYYSSFVDCFRTFDVDVKDFSREQFDKNLIESARRKLDQCLMMVQVIQATRGSARRVNDIKNKDNFLDMGRSKENDEKLIHIVETYARKGWLVG